MDVQTSMRLPAELLQRADALIAELKMDPALSMMGKITRSKVLRLALSEGLAALESRHRLGSSEVELRPRASLPRARALTDPPPPPHPVRAHVPHTDAHPAGPSMAMEED